MSSSPTDMDQFLNNNDKKDNEESIGQKDLMGLSPSIAPTTSLRAKLSRHPSISSVHDNGTLPSSPPLHTAQPQKMKLKLQLSQQPFTISSLQTTPILLSPRGTPTTSPDNKSDSFFPNFETHQQSHIDNIFDKKDLLKIPGHDTSSPPISPSTGRPLLSPSFLQRLPSSSAQQQQAQQNTQQQQHQQNAQQQQQQQQQQSSLSGQQKSLNKTKQTQKQSYNQLPEPVRPQTSILKSNFNTKNSQKYQQQEKMYLASITKYKNRYLNNDDYYDKFAVPDDVETDTENDTETENVPHNHSISSISSSTIPALSDASKQNLSVHGTIYNNILKSKTNSLDSKILESEDFISNDINREYEALKALSQQLCSEVGNKQLETITEYSLDSNVLLDLLNRNDETQLNNPSDANRTAISERIEWQTMLQTVLTGDVVTGEKTKLVKPLTSEMENNNLLRIQYNEDFWIGIRAKLYGRTEEEQRRLVLYHRGMVDDIIDEILNFKLVLPNDGIGMSYIDKVAFASSKVSLLLEKYEKCQELWRTSSEMRNDKPQCATPEFSDRIDCLVAWMSVTEAVERESNVLKQWVGNDDLDILKPSNDYDTDSDQNNNHKNSNNHIFRDDRPFVEKILKEKDIENLFDKRLFKTFSHWTIKAKTSYLQYHQYFNLLGLPSYLDILFVLTNFPSKLMKEIIKMRLDYAKKVKNPTMMMIDQTLDDLKIYLKLAIEIRISMLEYCAPVEGWISFPDYQDIEFDNTIVECVEYYMVLVNKKLLFSSKSTKSFRTYKEPDELEREWIFLQNMGFYINGISAKFSTSMTSLFIKLINRLYAFLQNQIQGPPSDGYRLDSQRLIRWYTSTMENFGQLRRKFIRFETNLVQYYHNSVKFKVLPNKTQNFFSLLKDSNHALYHNSKIAENGIYLFVSESLVNRPYDVQCILESKYLGVNFSKIPKRHLDVIKSYHPSIENYAYSKTHKNEGEHQNEHEKSNLGDESTDSEPANHTSLSTVHNEEAEDDDEYNEPLLDYVIAIVPPKALMWDGLVVPFEEMSKVDLDPLMRGEALFLTMGGHKYNAEEIFDVFKRFTSSTIGSNSKLVCSLPSLSKNFNLSLKLFSRISSLTIDSTSTIRNQCRSIGKCQELVNNVFMFARDVGRDTIRTTFMLIDSRSARNSIILCLIKLSIEWLSFIVDDCSPSDVKTFRWCVSALEFAMDVTRGFNILTLDAERFYRLKEKVAACMSLLISHFDIMGARAKELQKSRMQNYNFKIEKDIFTLDDESLRSLREHIMSQVNKIEEERRLLQVEQSSVGRVLDDTNMENQLLSYLASSFSSVSIRWQKGKFLGGGTFGSVFASVNLDTGGPMAVKEIKFQDRQSIKTIVPAIKGEMSVLELLSHPNIVQFFGVEVHRDRVYIFMEYCSGGSLSNLLEYGRIEDEIVIQLYTLQMLEALAYLHQFGIVHRDVKPDNILLDHMGVIKFVDFGSAKVIAIPNSGSGTASNNGTVSNDDKNSNNSNNSGSNLMNSSNVSTSSLNIPTPTEYVPSSSTSSISSNINTGENSRYHGYSNNNNNASASIKSNSVSSISPYNGITEEGEVKSRRDSIIGNTINNVSMTASMSANGNTSIMKNIGETKKSHALTGTPMYMSPETIKGGNMGRFGAMDIWSLGCCVLEMSTGRRPWSNLDNEFAVMYHIAAGHLPLLPNNNELSEQGQDFLKKCLTINPENRASAVELLQHPWIQSIRNEAFNEGDYGFEE
ncbi:mitogen-activated protein kinase kinase kinase [Pichia kluyveri]|uniref:Mitogen-activated protein kinase kinase kinase n=1 Tax=Pichia kluyveri TaxID=36015 RepID=A0AAV5RBI0_PICKL|nr:mitogen-activated protein kinase kinase kinase [Pichia kluyveri]